MTHTPREPLDYPVDAPEGVDPVIYRAMIIQAMTFHFFNAMQQMPNVEACLDYAAECAKAAWSDFWGSDPQPRTIELAAQAVRDQLEYWTED